MGSDCVLSMALDPHLILKRRHSRSMQHCYVLKWTHSLLDDSLLVADPVCPQRVGSSTYETSQSDSYPRFHCDCDFFDCLVVLSSAFPSARAIGSSAVFVGVDYPCADADKSSTTK